jgi:nicotinamide mononucleotide adenylyltransferase
MGSAASSVANRLRPSANLPAASKNKSKGKNMTTTANPSTTAATARPSHDPHDPHDPKSAVAEEAVAALSQEYAFPHDKLRRRLRGANKTPLVLVACGSFSPVTVLHLDMFELAERHIERTKFEIVGNYMSPCSDTYGKSSLVPVHHRIEMCKLAIQERQSNVMIDEWEALRRDSSGRPIYTRTADVLKRLDEQLNDVLGGIQTVDGETVRAKVMMLIGADLAMTMSDPNIWAPSDIDVLLGYYGAFIVERPHACNIQQAVEPLSKYKANIWVVPSFQNDVSSTKVRAQLRNGENAMDLPKSVFEYIKLHRLYEDVVASTPAKETGNSTD